MAEQLHRTLAPLPLWVITANPEDMPGKIVARLHLVGCGPTRHFFLGETLDQVRAMLPRGLACMKRAAEDDAVIVESWI